MANATREFLKQYSDTYASYSGKKGNYPFLVMDAEGDANEVMSVTGALLKPIGKEIRSEMKENVEIGHLDLTPPHLGCINLRTVCTYVAWNQRRQWKRGFTKERALYSTAMGSVLLQRNAMLRNILSRREDVWHVFNPYYVTHEEGYGLLSSGRRFSVAISDKFWMAISPVLNDVVIGYKTWPVGIYSSWDKMGLLLPDFLHLSQELSEYLDVNELKEYGGKKL